MVVVSTAMTEAKLVFEMTMLFILLQTLCCVLVFFLQTDLNRMKIDMNEDADEQIE